MKRGFNMQLELLEKEFIKAFGQEITFSLELTKDAVPTWDSIRYISFMVSLEKAFKIKFSHQAVAGLKTIGEILEYINQQVEKTNAF